MFLLRCCRDAKCHHLQQKDKNEINKANLSLYDFLYVNAGNGKQALFAAYQKCMFLHKMWIARSVLWVAFGGKGL